MLISHMEEDLRLSRAYLVGLTARASHCYRRIEVPKASGGRRVVHHPNPELKCLQRWLNRNVLSTLPVHSSAHAYRQGVGLEVHASVHAASEYMLRLDLAHFFPSIVRRDVERYMAENAHCFTSWSNADSEFFLRTVLRFARLTIGAPSSPALSNAMCIELDTQLAAYSSPRGISYTRYADDLYFSCAEPNLLCSVERAVAQLLRALPYPANLRINRRKTLHSSRRNRRVVTGVILTPSGELSVGRKRKRAIRSLVFGVAQLSEQQRKAAAGLLGSVQPIEPGFLRRLREKYGDKVDQLLR